MTSYVSRGTLSCIARAGSVATAGRVMRGWRPSGRLLFRFRLEARTFGPGLANSSLECLVGQ